jgi:ATP-dependent helicase HrpA
MVRQAAEHDTELRLLAILTRDGRQLFADIADRAISDAVLGDAQDPPRTQVQYQARLEKGRSEIVEAGERIIGNVRRTLLALKELRGQLDAPALRGYPQGIQAITSQVERLIAPGWVRTVPAPWFERLAKYLQAAGRRAERMAGDRTRDLRLAGELARYQQAYDALANAADPDGPPAPELEQLRWMIEEFRLSLFAQNLRTLAPVSAKRLDEAVSQARREAGRA